MHQSVDCLLEKCICALWEFQTHTWVKCRESEWQISVKPLSLSLNCSIGKANGKLKRNLCHFLYKLCYSVTNDKTVSGCSWSKTLTAAKWRIIMHVSKNATLCHWEKYFIVTPRRHYAFSQWNSLKVLHYLGFPESVAICRLTCFLRAPRKHCTICRKHKFLEGAENIHGNLL